jgi:hypothetical protein
MRHVPAIVCASGMSKPCQWNHCSAYSVPTGDQYESAFGYATAPVSSARLASGRKKR